jgi:hypothetical protein
MNFNDDFKYKDCCMYGKYVKSVNSNYMQCKRCNYASLVYWIEYKDIKLCKYCCVEISNRIKNEEKGGAMFNFYNNSYESWKHELKRPKIKYNEIEFNGRAQVLMMQDMYNKSCK